MCFATIARAHSCQIRARSEDSPRASERVIRERWLQYLREPKRVGACQSWKGRAQDHGHFGQETWPLAVGQTVTGIVQQAQKMSGSGRHSRDHSDLAPSVDLGTMCRDNLTGEAVHHLGA